MNGIKNPQGVFEKGQQLLDLANPEMAVVYFILAGEMYENIANWEMAAKSYEKAAFSFELDDKLDQAKQQYSKANECRSKSKK